MNDLEKKKEVLKLKKSRIEHQERLLKLKERKKRTRVLIEIGGTAAKAKIDHLNTNTLFGAFLEGAVTQIALSMLLEGYDIYVCADQVKTADAARETIFLERIRYCAGHVVTLPQILLELLSQEENDKKRQALLNVLNSVRGSI